MKIRYLLASILILTGTLEAQQRRPMGWRSDPNHAQGLTQMARHTAYRAAPLPPAASVESGIQQVYDQWHIGSCVANAAAAAFDHNWKARTGFAADPSRLDIYQNCLRKDGVYPRDYGTYTSTVLWVLKNKGTLREITWPYHPPNLSAHAPTDRRRERAKYAAIRTYDVSNTDNGYSVKQAIANAKLPVLVGGYVYDGIFYVKKSDPYIPMPSGRIAGGHEMLVVAYDDNREWNGLRGFVKVLNSWGKEWGDGGYAWMPYAYVFNPKQFEDFGAIEATGKRIVRPRTPQSAPIAGGGGRFIETKKVFTGEPLLVEEVAGSRHWRLMRDVIYITKDGYRIVAKAGRITDFASIPQAFWSIWPPYDPRYGKAAVIHDDLYKTQGQQPGRQFTRKEADIIFRNAMHDLGAPRYLRDAMYWCVRGFNKDWKPILPVDTNASASINSGNERASRQTKRAGSVPARGSAVR